MARKVNYRHEHYTSAKVVKYAPRHIARLGKLHTIEGYRWRSQRSFLGESGQRNYWENTHERVRIRGKNGQCLFDGVCWGYPGSGPQALRAILMECGLSKATAESVAFHAPRHDEPGVDWKIELNEDGSVHIHFNDQERMVA